jgi:release factor glutamine methyltransferase
MNKFLRALLLPVPRLVTWYLSRKRTYSYQDLTIEVLPGVFHPGLFFSTTFMLEFIEQQHLDHSTLLEIGAGTGIVSLAAAKEGALVTATDISPSAIKNMEYNAQRNNVSLTIIQSNLFENVPKGSFDWIIVNPPYYPKDPVTSADFAWYCGKDHEYFRVFFGTVSSYMTATTQTIMVLSDVCALEIISRIAAEHGLALIKLAEKKIWADGNNYLYRIKRIG